jgi:endonuclease/exonuclease/phosphatase (EEP) superfamily protein YafD
MGRHDDAHQLRARSAILVDHDWRAAEAELRKVQYKTWFDWELMLQILNMKEQDEAIRRDAVAMKAVKEQKEEALRRTLSTVEFRD